MDCNENIFSDYLSNCNADFTLNALLTPGHSYKWVITDKFGNEYSGTAPANAYGTGLLIDLTDPATLPAGLINSYGGVFALKLYDTTDECKQISFKMTRFYDEVFFTTKRGTAIKDTLGCTFD